ncbi:6320_t:CDS:2 [Acaulospora morrowiae]|uniref:6320_t:CDS:1 n=1 Tax=Acaulospora morrowiae TaxID=94023 RepID=A0A9N8ZI57_9GLOM|nr:6320_t:CDS:2 [Acaulospora morrowiae]
MTVYLKLVGVSRNKLDAIKRQLEKYGLTMRIHSNTKCLPQRSSKVTITHDNAKEVSSFILNYADINGLPRPAMKSINRNNDQISQSSFVRLWKLLISHIRFITPKSDLCNVCKTLKWKIGHTNKPEDKEELLVEYAIYIRIAKLECKYYNDNIKKAKENASHTINIHLSLASKERPISNTVDAIAHFCYNWTQSVPIPYSPQQIDPLYFKNKEKFPVGVVKGANTILSLVYNTLIEYNRACYKKSVVNTVDDIVEVTRMSTHGNNAICYRDHK